MSKFIKKATKKTTKPVKKVAKVKVVDVPVDEPQKEVIKKGNQEFVVCPKCGWKHTPDTKRCRFCGVKIGE